MAEKKKRPKKKPGEGNILLYQAAFELRRSGAAVPRPSGKRYVRRPKYKGAVDIRVYRPLDMCKV